MVGAAEWVSGSGSSGGGVSGARVMNGGGHERWFFFLFSFFCLAMYSSFFFFLSELAIASNFLFWNKLIVLMEQYILVMLFQDKSLSNSILIFSSILLFSFRLGNTNRVVL